MTAPHRRPASAPTLRDLADAEARAADRGLSWTIASLPDDVLVADLDGVVYLDPDQDVGAAAARLVETLDDMCAETDRPARHLHVVRPAEVVGMVEGDTAVGA